MASLMSLIILVATIIVVDYRKNGEIRFRIVLGILFVTLISLPGIKRDFEEKTADIDISSKNIYSLNLKEDLENIKDEFKIKDEIGLYGFQLEYLDSGEITNIQYDLIESNEKNKKRYIVYYNKDKTDGKYLVRRYKDSNYEYIRENASDDINEIFEKIELIKEERPINKYEEYRIIVVGYTRYHHENDRSIFVDKNNNMKELTNDDLPVEGLFIILEGTKREGFDVNTTAATHSRLGTIDFIFE